MRVLLTGAAGFLGSQVHRALLEAEHEVVALDLMLPRVHGPDATPPDEVAQVDVRDGAAVEPLLAGVDVVCHLAAITAAADPAEYAEHNDRGTAALLGALGRAKIRRLVLASSIVVYGEGRYRSAQGGPFFPGLRRRADLDRGLFDHRAPRTGEILTWEPVIEDAPQRPRGYYAASKAAQENYALAWGLDTGASVTALRYSQIYGPGARAGLVGRYAATLDEGRAPQVSEDGGQVRDFVHVRDATAAMVAAVEHPLPGYAPLNIASGKPITLWQVASIMSKARSGPAPVVTGQYHIGDVRHIVADPENARRALGFTVTTPPIQGLAEPAPDAAEPSEPTTPVAARNR